MTEKEVQELKRMEYTKYLKTDYWLDIRTKVKEKYGNKCNRCGMCEDLHVHHHKYTHRGEGRKEIRDVELICKICHYKEHKCKKDHVCSIMGDYVRINTEIFGNEDTDILTELYPLLNNCIDWEYNEVLQPQLKKLYKNNTKGLTDLMNKMTEEIIFMEIEGNIYINPLIVHKRGEFNKGGWEERLTKTFVSKIT